MIKSNFARACGLHKKWISLDASFADTSIPERETALRVAGFGDMRSQTAVASAIPDFRSYALDSDLKGQIRKPDSLFIEARKPERV